MNKTDAEIEKALECCAEPHSSCKDMGCPFQKLCLEDLDALQKYALDYINRLKKENEDLFYKLSGVMLSVDKWLEGDELNQDEVQRAATMREKTLQITERQEIENERLVKYITNTLSIIPQKAKAEAIKEFAERLTDRICENVNRSLDNPDGNNYYPIDVYKDIDNLVKEMTENEGKE